MTAKIEPWMIDAMKSLHCEEYYTDAMAECDARHIAAHAPQEPHWTKEQLEAVNKDADNLACKFGKPKLEQEPSVPFMELCRTATLDEMYPITNDMPPDECRARWHDRGKASFIISSFMANIIREQEKP